MFTFLVIPADLSKPLRFVDLSKGADHLKALQEAVGGYIEAIVQPRNREITVYANEDGKMRGLPANRRASQLWEALWPDSVAKCSFDTLVGDVVICGPARNGKNISVPVTVRAAVEKMGK